MITKPCKYCNKVFQSKRTTAEYCSNSCRVNFNLAKKRNLDVPAEKIEVETNSNEDYIVETQRNDSQQLDRLMLDNSNLKTKIDDLTKVYRTLVQDYRNKGIQHKVSVNRTKTMLTKLRVLKSEQAKIKSLSQKLLAELHGQGITPANGEHSALGLHKYLTKLRSKKVNGTYFDPLSRLGFDTHALDCLRSFTIGNFKLVNDDFERFDLFFIGN